MVLRLFESGTNLLVLFQASCHGGEAQKLNSNNDRGQRPAREDARSRFNLRKI
jgi:hypothetical protein